MQSTAIHRLESLLQAKKLDGTLARPWTTDPGASVAATGLDWLDAALGGGWRRGEVSELVGVRSSGRTCALLATLAAATERGEVVGLVDAVDRFDPRSAAGMGVDLDRVLWIRGASLTVEAARPQMIELAVHQAIRACDLLLRAGGFGIVALDLADVPARWVRALPHTTWWRMAHANEGRPTACVLMGDAPMGRSARGRSVQVRATSVWTGESAQSRRFQGLQIEGRA